MKIRNYILGTSLTALGLGFTVSALAQGIEEVIVTAQKREESSQDIPIAIDVIAGGALVEEGVRDIKDIGKTSTELEINTRQGQATVVGFRGMQQAGFAPTGDTLSAVHLDGIFLNNFWGMNGMMFDLERVEALAGPQGTLYGRNSAAGAVNLITRRPGREFAADATVEYGSFDTIRLGGGASMPLSDTHAVRLAGTKYKRDALYTDGEAAIDQWAGRLSVNWTPTENDTLFFTYDYINTGGTNENGGLYAVNTDVRAYNPGTNTFSASPPLSVTNFTGLVGDPFDNKAFITARDLVFSGQTESIHWGAMAQYTHDFGSFDTVFQFSHRDLEAISRVATKPRTAVFPQVYPQIAETDVAELRFVSDDEGSLTWVGGLFWFKGTTIHGNASPNFSVPTGSFTGVLNTATGPISILGTAQDPNTGLDVPGCPCVGGFSPVNGQTEAYAAYGQTTWTPESMDKWHFTLGLRYSYDKKETTNGYYVNSVLHTLWVPDANSIPSFLQGSIISPAQALPGLPATVVHTDGSDTWDQVQYRLGVDYDVSDTSMVYGSISTGYKSGGFAYGSTPKLKPETLLAYEIGSKNRFFDNTLQLNASAWWYDYSDLEVPTSRPLSPPFAIVNNSPLTVIPSVGSAGKVNLGGVSFDLDWAATANDRFGVSMTYVYSKIIDGFEELDGVRTEVLRKGQRLGDTPKFQWLGRYSHTFELSNGASIVPALKYQYQTAKYDGGVVPAGSVPVGAALNPAIGRYNLERATPGQTTIPAQGILDFQIKFASASNSWDVTAYVHNLTDELDIKNLAYTNNPLGGGATGNYGQTVALLGEPRTYGVILGMRF